MVVELKYRVRKYMVRWCYNLGAWSLKCCKWIIRFNYVFPVLVGGLSSALVSLLLLEFNGWFIAAIVCIVLMIGIIMLYVIPTSDCYMNYFKTYCCNALEREKAYDMAWNSTIRNYKNDRKKRLGSKTSGESKGIGGKDRRRFLIRVGSSYFMLLVLFVSFALCVYKGQTVNRLREQQHIDWLIEELRFVKSWMKEEANLKMYARPEETEAAPPLGSNTMEPYNYVFDIFALRGSNDSR